MTIVVIWRYITKTELNLIEINALVNKWIMRSCLFYMITIAN